MKETRRNFLKTERRRPSLFPRSFPPAFSGKMLPATVST